MSVGSRLSDLLAVLLLHFGANTKSVIFRSRRKFSQFGSSSGTLSLIIRGSNRARHHICDAIR